jgi:hypothetical protein
MLSESRALRRIAIALVLSSCVASSSRGSAQPSIIVRSVRADAVRKLDEALAPFVHRYDYTVVSKRDVPRPAQPVRVRTYTAHYPPFNLGSSARYYWRRPVTITINREPNGDLHVTCASPDDPHSTDNPVINDLKDLLAQQFGADRIGFAYSSSEQRARRFR